jgi:hypothetical protein
MDKERRNFLKIILIGSGTLLAGRVLGPLFSKCAESVPVRLTREKPAPPPQTISSAFKIVENDKRLSIYDNHGEEIFQIDKEG